MSSDKDRNVGPIFRSSGSISPRHFPRGPQGNLTLTGAESDEANIELFMDSEIHAVHLGTQQCTDLLPGNPTLQSMRITFGRLNDPSDPKHTLHLIPQFQWLGSGYAVSEMLMMDKGLEPSLANLVFKGIDDGNSMEQRLQEAGIPARFEWNERVDPLKRLRELIQLHRSTVVQIGGEIGQHYIIVDTIDDLAGVAHIREPYHGWAIAVELQALQLRLEANGPGLQALYVESRDRMADLARTHKQFDDFLAQHSVLHQVCATWPWIRSAAFRIYRCCNKSA